MRRNLMVLIVVLGGAIASAQDSGGGQKPYNGNFYGFFMAGQCQHGYGIFGGGGGAEAFLWKGISVGFDAGYQQFTDGWGFGTVTPQFGYHFINRNKPVKWDPFVTVGGGAAFTGGVTGTANIGGGVTYWIKPRWGVRFEYRPTVVAWEEGIHTFRFGVTFR